MRGSRRVAHVWCRTVAETAGAGDVLRAADVEWALDEAELRRRETLRRPSDRSLFTAAWGLVRHALSEVEPRVGPHEWRFLRSGLGRPEVHAPDWCRSLRFNLSHTDGTVACVVTRELRCGVDVERSGRALPLPRLARAVLSPRERRELDAAPAGRRQELFLRYWTVKEAYLKAIGSGLRFPMPACEFDVGTGRPRLRSLGAGHEHARYTFRQWAAPDGGFLAVAIQGRTVHGPERDVPVRVRTPRPREESPQPTAF
ncbi:hypothetical protein DDQ41_00030 [Streptomyces spongiicola]|uniref:4'-phosphopantetheinyl transferase domain-containing protein n=1 Tax=Streptomyces spongiicola TaxID=1690221 RepID=A0ABM6V0W2_9ACTN|nr:hypothetical protein DDQ41_00030 [Streptomyces spongiicola]